METEPGTTYVITSGKGGVGKTTVTANLGVALALRGNRVVVIDADIGLRNLDMIMGLENRVVYDLVQTIEGTCQLHQAMIRDRLNKSLYLIPAAQTRDKNAVTGEQMREVCEQLKPDFEYILIDSPAGIEQGFRNAVTAADKAIVVTSPEVAAIRDADRVIGLIEAAGLPTPDLILNRVRPEMVRRRDMMSTEDILSLLSVNLLGLVPEDQGVIISTNRGVPVAHDSKSESGKAFCRIAARLDGEEVPSVALAERVKFIQRLKKLPSLKLNGRGRFIKGLKKVPSLRLNGRGRFFQRFRKPAGSKQG
ncbi:MAG: septum site-determining protein MinD [Candidatus Neomarinimicrobiota bacterium]